VLDYDDTDSVNLVHASASVVPSLIATARRHAVTGRDLLLALVAGYEVESKLGAQLGRPLTARGWHVSGVIGPFGAAAAALLATRDSVERIAQAMAIASTGASGLIAAFGTMSKSLQLGRTAAGGILAADLARRDFDGPVTVLDGHEFARPYVDVALAFETAARDFGGRFAILDNSFKPHAACMITHAAIDAAACARTALAQADAQWEDVSSIDCRVNVLVPEVAGIARPRSGLQGKFSVAYCVATAILDGRAGQDAFSDAAVARHAIGFLLDRIRIRTDASIGEKAAEVTVTLADARRFVERVQMARGHPANPLADADLGEKFMSLATGALHVDAATVLDELWHFDTQPDARRWLARRLDALRSPGTHSA
jgi:2-methylcitrate dehydratase PrpD